MEDRFLSNCSLSLSLYLRASNPSQILDTKRVAIGREILSSTGAGVWRKAPKALPDSNSAPDKSLVSDTQTTKSQSQKFTKSQ